MKRKTLEIEYSFDFDLWALHSAAKPHKLAWELNHGLGVALSRQADMAVPLKNKAVASFAHFLFDNGVRAIRLFRNKPTDPEAGKIFLVPELPLADYILYVRPLGGEEGNRLQEVLRNIPSVEWAAFLPLASLKEKDRFLF